LAVEIVNINHFFNTNPDQLPDRYRRPAFWVVRFLLAVVAGGMAAAYDIDKPLLAANVGAATPAILQALAQGFTPPTPGENARLSPPR
jgi:hypothetical protein